jgi:stage III sporulation protein AA
MKLDSLLIYLPERLSMALISLKVSNITEIRMRANLPASVTCDMGNITFDKNGNITTPEKGLCLTNNEISSSINALCKYSKYSYESFINNGFIPIDDGARAGVCGKAVTENGKIISFSEITSVNIRLNTFLPEIAKDAALLMKKSPCGIAIYSPPGKGKTTYLKSLIHLLSLGKFTPPYRIGVIDERFELCEGNFKKGFCDVISGVSKSVGIELFTRTMSPEIIVCDEIFKGDEDAILSGCNAGVSFICSFHGESMESLLKRNFVSNIVNSGVFKYSIRIEKIENEYKYTIEPTRRTT